jgi:hypothetical protein
MFKKQRILLVALLALMCKAPQSFAQNDSFERGQQLQYLDLGIRQFENGDYDAADESFRQVLQEVKVLPAEICYFFGGKFLPSWQVQAKYKLAFEVHPAERNGRTIL